MNFLMRLDRFNTRLTQYLGHLATLALFLMFAIIVFSVFMRYLLNDSLHWAEESSRYLMVWMTFLFFPMAHKRHLNVKVDFAVSWFSHTKAGQVLNLLLECLVFFIVIYCVQLTWGMVMNASNMAHFNLASFLDIEMLRTSSTTSSALNLPMCYVYLVMPFSFLIVALCSFENIMRLLMRVLGIASIQAPEMELVPNLETEGTH